ncbi:MAG: beta,2-mannobiose phosphorylase / 1,2-beta-oligomannan phosphorylase [Candidatus Parcubacteria bacterium]|nr:beta,2-mannobiose phosphorylase / 1,2-beta-oligomannan phosphorylase [Candidatus Parcubacteria bacterium]
MNNLASIISFFAFCLALLICFYAYIVCRKYIRGRSSQFRLTRLADNPVISPLPFREWEMRGTFNPAAIQDDEGHVHLFYRAIGDDGISRIGHAESADGLHFEERSMYPVYEPEPGYGLPDAARASGPKVYNPAYYTSGGGWGGAEDPRAVRLEDRVYMTYTAFEGWDSVRMALTSIGLGDLKRGLWRWRLAALISPPGHVAKNWVLFPEKIHGKYAVLHGIAPRILIDYVDSLDALGSHGMYIRSQAPNGGRKDFWDNWVRGAGPPPLRTSIGWLLLYHAMDKNDPNKYKLGAMVLDLEDPTKVLYRSPQPILTPEMSYENDGKPGVVYASGAVIMRHATEDALIVYYGGGDRHVCIAQTPLEPLLDWLVKNGRQ